MSMYLQATAIARVLIPNQIALRGYRYRDLRLPGIHRRMRICQNGEGPVTPFLAALMWIMKRATSRIDILPLLPVVFGLGEIEAAAAIGVSASKFRLLVKEARMPLPRRIGSRSVWDVDELRAAFKALPHEGEAEGGSNTWADVV